jgi:hypothetical protein
MNSAIPSLQVFIHEKHYLAKNKDLLNIADGRVLDYLASGEGAGHYLAVVDSLSTDLQRFGTGLVWTQELDRETITRLAAEAADNLALEGMPSIERRELLAAEGSWYCYSVTI